MTENQRRVNNRDEYVKTKKVQGENLDNFGVTSTFYKAPEDEDNFTNHAPDEPPEVPPSEIAHVQHWLEKYPHHENSLKNMLMH